MTRIIYYTTLDGKNPVAEFLDSQEKRTKAKVFKIFQFIEDYGLSSTLSHIKRLTGTQLWEIRILGKDSIRIFYISIQKNDILVLNCFIKKTQKTPIKEISLALDRAANWKKRKILDK